MFRIAPALVIFASCLVSSAFGHGNQQEDTDQSVVGHPTHGGFILNHGTYPAERALADLLAALTIKERTRPEDRAGQILISRFIVESLNKTHPKIETFAPEVYKKIIAFHHLSRKEFPEDGDAEKSRKLGQEVGQGLKLLGERYLIDHMLTLFEKGEEHLRFDFRGLQEMAKLTSSPEYQASEGAEFRLVEASDAGVSFRLAGIDYRYGMMGFLQSFFAFTLDPAFDNLYLNRRDFNVTERVAKDYEPLRQQILGSTNLHPELRAVLENPDVSFHFLRAIGVYLQNVSESAGVIFLGNEQILQNIVATPPEKITEANWASYALADWISQRLKWQGKLNGESMPTTFGENLHIKPLVISSDLFFDHPRHYTGFQLPNGLDVSVKWDADTRSLDFTLHRPGKSDWSEIFVIDEINELFGVVPEIENVRDHCRNLIDRI
ncbi:MAG TPA: hypothetical protein VM901_02770 [Bdellovibrionota bacterium]|nr:hypothetical protein [Bdellovibrionota bacterium]